MKTIAFRARKVYGVTRNYFISPKLENMFEELTGRKTLTQRDMDILSEMFDVTWSELGR